MIRIAENSLRFDLMYVSLASDRHPGLRAAIACFPWFASALAWQ